MADYQQKLANILKNYFPDNLINKSQEGINRLEAYKAQKYRGLGDFPGSQTGYNFTSNPQQYLGYAPPSEVSLENMPDKNIGGYTNDRTAKIAINSQSSLDPLFTLVHEAQHRRDLVDKYKNYDFSKYANREELQNKFDNTTQKVVNNFYKSGGSGYSDPVELFAVSGQMAPNEIVAQLKSYEAGLPAGMTMFQSPLGKKIFNDNDSKLWWLQRTTTKLSDL